VRDHTGQALTYVYFEEELGLRSSAAKLVTKDEARRIGQLCEVAGAIAKVN